MTLAKRLSSLDEKAFTFEVLLAKGAIKALTVVIVIQSLYPAVTSLNRKPARDAFGGK